MSGPSVAVLVFHNGEEEEGPLIGPFVNMAGAIPCKWLNALQN